MSDPFSTSPNAAPVKRSARPIVTRWRWSVHRTDQLSGAAKTIALHLSCLMKADGYCYASATYLAAKAHLSRSTVYAAQRELDGAGWVTIGKRTVVVNGVQRKCNSFKARFPRGYKPDERERKAEPEFESNWLG